MGISINTGGQLKELISLSTNVGGQLKELISLSTNVGGQLKEIYTSLPEGLNLYWGGFTGASCRIEHDGGEAFNVMFSPYPVGKFKINSTGYVNFTCNESDAVTKNYSKSATINKIVSDMSNHIYNSGVVKFYSYYVVQLKTENSILATPYVSWVLSRFNHFRYSDGGWVLKDTDFHLFSDAPIITSDVQMVDRGEYYVYATRACLVQFNARVSGIPYKYRAMDFEGMEMNLNLNFQTLS